MELNNRIYFIYNPNSGNSKKIQSYLDNLILFISSQYKDVNCLRLSILDHDWELNIKSAKEKDLFVACGGDGTVVSVAEKLLGFSNVKLSVLPFGTGNDFSRTIGIFAIMKNYKMLAEVFVCNNAKEYNFDVWQIGQTRFLNYFSFGFDAKVTTHFQELRGKLPKFLRGPFANRIMYLFSGLWHLFYSNPKDVVLNYDNNKLNVSSSKVVLFCNINSYAGGRKIHSQINFNDQKLDLIINKGLSEFLKLTFGFGSKVELTQNQYQIESSSDLICQVDGEPKLIQKGIHKIKYAGTIKVVGV